jgi:NAD(P)-dependent dehydrogenase (short-subunit alcohol dehydrogenase family)
MGRLDGKVALVTGGGRGIGRGIVLEFALAGANIAINYRRDRDAADATAREVESLGRSALVVQADVGDRAAVDGMVGRCVRRSAASTSASRTRAWQAGCPSCTSWTRESGAG